MDTITNIITTILQFSFGAILGVLAWHLSPKLFRYVQKRMAASVVPQEMPSAGLKFRISGPDLVDWPIDRVWLNQYGIRNSVAVYDAKQISRPLSVLSNLEPELQQAIMGLHSEGRAPGTAISAFIGGATLPPGIGLALVLCESKDSLPVTWLIPVRNSQVAS